MNNQYSTQELSKAAETCEKYAAVLQAPLDKEVKLLKQSVKHYHSIESTYFEKAHELFKPAHSFLYCSLVNVLKDSDSLTEDELKAVAWLNIYEGASTKYLVNGSRMSLQDLFVDSYFEKYAELDTLHSRALVRVMFLSVLAELADMVVYQRRIYRMLVGCFYADTVRWGDSLDEARDVFLWLNDSPISLKTNVECRSIARYRSVDAFHVPEAYLAYVAVPKTNDRKLVVIVPGEFTESGSFLWQDLDRLKKIVG